MIRDFSEEMYGGRSNYVTAQDMGISMDESLDILEQTLAIILPSLGLQSVVAHFIDIHIREDLGKSLGSTNTYHGLTTPQYCAKRKKNISCIELNNTTLRNSDLLITTFLHEFAHMLNSTTSGPVMSHSIDRCGGHNDIFYEKNFMLLTLFRGDSRSKQLMANPHSTAYYVSRYVSIHYYNVDRPPAQIQYVPTTPSIPTENPKKRQKLCRRKLFEVSY